MMEHGSVQRAMSYNSRLLCYINFLLSRLLSILEEYLLRCTQTANRIVLIIYLYIYFVL